MVRLNYTSTCNPNKSCLTGSKLLLACLYTVDHHLPWTCNSKFINDSNASVPVRAMILLLVNEELSLVEDRSSGLPLHVLLWKILGYCCWMKQLQHWTVKVNQLYRPLWIKWVILMQLINNFLILQLYNSGWSFEFPCRVTFRVGLLILKRVV